MAKHEFQGHCQRCGRIQAVQVKNGVLAKHGYVVAGFGFFNGVCGGSGSAPLEQAKGYAIEIIAELGQYAAEQEKHGELLKVGKLFPRVAPKLERYGNEVRERRPGSSKSWPVFVEWAEANEQERRKAVERAIWQAEGNSRQAISHARELSKLVSEVHGKPLIPVKPEKAVLSVGAVLEIYGGKAVVKEIRVQEARGCGPFLNGQHVPHAIVHWEGSGRVSAIPVRIIRKFSNPI